MVRRPFELPLSRAGFRAALRKGHGRAWLHVAGHGARGLDEELYEACAHDLALDPQVDGPRAVWLIGLLERGGALDRLLPRLLALGSVAEGAPNAFFHDAQRLERARELIERGEVQAHAMAERILAARPELSDHELDEEPPRLPGGRRAGRFDVASRP